MENYMILDNENLGIGTIAMKDSSCGLSGKKASTKCIDIYSKNHDYRLTFWTTCDFYKFNELKLNEKTNITNFAYIDSYDIDFDTKENTTVNSEENAVMYFTKIDENKFIINVEINDFDKCVMGSLPNHKSLKIQTIIDFN